MPFVIEVLIWAVVIGQIVFVAAMIGVCCIARALLKDLDPW